MGLHGNEILVDELRGDGIVVGFGIQPSTGTSSRRSAEVEQNRLVFLFRKEQRLIDVLAPIHGHGFASGTERFSNCL
jgi:hypothetical protein